MSRKSADAQCAPVLVIGYRRPQHVSQVMAAVAAARPRRLFLACDGPNSEREGDEELVAATRAAMEAAIDWDCTVERLYRPVNVGCRVGVSTAIDWFFDHVSEGIILEDDCVPHRDFFTFCTELLERYRWKERVMHISGDGALVALRDHHPDSYVFTTETLVWGWATWRDAWATYDRDLARWSGVRRDPREMRRVFRRPSIAAYWARRLDRLLIEGVPDTWDYQWSFTVMERGGRAIVPTSNLITNIGFGADATHTQASDGPRAGAPTESLGMLVHPRSSRVRRRIDRAIQQEVRGISSKKDSLRIRSRKGIIRGLLRTRRAAASFSRAFGGRAESDR